MRYTAKAMAIFLVLAAFAGCSGTSPGPAAGTETARQDPGAAPAETKPRPGTAAVQPGAGQLHEKASGFVLKLARKEWSAAEGMFNAQMKAALPQDKLEATWTQVTGQYGDFLETLDAKEGTERGYKTVTVACKFERATLNIKLVFDQSGEIGGMWFV